MNKKERKEEKDLINQIREFRKLFRNSLKKKLFKEREERHRMGEVFFKGFWVSQKKLSNIQKVLLKRGRIVFFEIHLLVIMVVLFNFLLWIIFERFLLP